MSLFDGDSSSEPVPHESPADLSSCHSQDSDRETHNSGHDTGGGNVLQLYLVFPNQSVILVIS